MKWKASRPYVDGCGTVQRVLELDVLAARGGVEAFDPEGEDPFLNPWIRGYNTTIRRARGH
jgi:hypothetical protein